MTSTQPPGIQLKLTYNRQKNLPRNFFIHLYNVPSDATVRINYRDQDLPSTNNNGYVDARFWIEPDIEVSITISRGDTLLASGVYLVHNEEIFECLISPQQRLDLIQWAYGL